jgi:hypothetical protein
MNFGGDYSDASSDASSIVDISLLLATKPSSPSATTTEDIRQTHPQQQQQRQKQQGSSPDNNIESNEQGKTSSQPEDNGKIRIVMGESVQRWRHLRQNPDDSETSSYSSNNNNHKEEHIVLRHTDTSAAGQVRLEDSQLELLEDNKVTLQVSLPNSNKNIVYTAKVRPPPSSSSLFVDCIALWDSKRQVYVLEIPKLVATDLMPNVAPTTTTATADAANLILKNNPIEQLRQAEQKVRKRRNPPTTGKRPPKSAKR